MCFSYNGSSQAPQREMLTSRAGAAFRSGFLVRAGSRLPQLSLFHGSAGRKVFSLVTIVCNFYSYFHTLTIAKLLIYTRTAVTDSIRVGYVGRHVIVLFCRFDPVFFHPVAESYHFVKRGNVFVH
jgi:hypothetical protein